MTNQERLQANNTKIEAIQQTLANKLAAVDTKDMLQARVDAEKSCAYLFYGCSNIDIGFLKGLDTSKATSMFSMFHNSSIKNLDLGFLDVSIVSSIINLCNRASVKSVILPQFNLKVAVREAFYQCTSLETVDVKYLKVTDAGNLFYSCTKLTSIDGQIDVKDATSVNSLIWNCTNLTNITLKNIDISTTIGSGTSWGHLLTLDSLLNTIKELHINTTTNTLKLTMGSANLEKLADVYVKLVDITDEMRAEDEYIDNKLPFEVCESTDEGAMTILDDYMVGLKNWQYA